MVRWLTLLLIPFSLLFAVEILSDSLTTQADGSVVAEGNVYVDYGDYLITASRIRYLPKEKKVYAYGKVRVIRKDGTFEVTGSEAYVDLETETGYFLDAQGRFRSFYFQARRVDKTGRDRYRIEDGDVTTCPPDRKEMKLCFWRAQVTDRYVFSFSNSLKFFGVPFAYTPLAVFPVGERRSGLLPPLIGMNTYNSFIYIQPFYWAISQDRDATLTLDYRDRQAKGMSLEYRQAFSPGERMLLRLSYYREPAPPGEWWEGRNRRSFRENRFRLEFSTSSGGWKLGLDLPSDPYFFEDVYFSRKRRTTPYTLSYITYTRSSGDYLLFINLRSYYDLTSDTNRRSLHLLPELSFYHRPRRVGGVYLSLTSSFTNFHREEGLRSRRFLFVPRIDVPLRVVNLNNYLSLRLLNSFYHTGGSWDDRVMTFQLENRLPLFHSLSYGELSLLNVLELVYSFSPENFNNPQFDSFDEVVKENNLKLRWSSSLLRSRRTLAGLFVEGGYNVLESYRFPTDSALVEEKLLPFRIRASLYPSDWLTLTEDLIYDANLNVVARSVSTAHLKMGKLRLRGSYVSSRNSRDIRIADQYRVGGEIGLRGLLVGASVTRDNLTGKELYRQLYTGYRGACWTLKLDYRRTYYGVQKGYIREVYLAFNVFNLREFTLPLRRR